jgi:putative ATP-dependent endonuclease of the OLD family
VIIGRNNSGKTTLLDMVDHVLMGTDINEMGHQGRTPEVLFLWNLTEEIINKIVPRREVFVDIRGIRQEFDPVRWALSKLDGNHTVWTIEDSTKLRLKSLEFESNRDIDGPMFDEVEGLIESRIYNLPLPLSGITFRHLAADRDLIIEPSVEHDQNLVIKKNGAGATQIITRFINSRNSVLDRDHVEKDLLDALNEIMGDDATFERILIHEHETAQKEWEVVLEERNKGRIPMSQTGSGLKTVLLVLINLLLVPRMKENDVSLSKCWFAFEELENNLHPAIQRRLYRYLREKAVTEKCRFFITTHSNVVIDLFANDPIAQILHVKHDGESATVQTIGSKGEGFQVLDDLGVHASDLLQTNVVIWVEGPSDRIYLRKWIDIWSNGELVEGLDYQILPLGGAQNAHFSFENEEVVDDLIKTLNINRHAIMMADSDRKKVADGLKVHTARLEKEVNKSGGYAWITAGREVENYIPETVWKKQFKDPDFKCPKQFRDAVAHYRKQPKCTSARKVDIANKMVEYLDRDSIAGRLDMAKHLTKICQLIRKWNGVKQDEE